MGQQKTRIAGPGNRFRKVSKLKGLLQTARRGAGKDKCNGICGSSYDIKEH